MCMHMCMHMHTQPRARFRLSSTPLYTPYTSILVGPAAPRSALRGVHSVPGYTYGGVTPREIELRYIRYKIEPLLPRGRRGRGELKGLA